MGLGDILSLVDDYGLPLVALVGVLWIFWQALRAIGRGDYVPRAAHEQIVEILQAQAEQQSAELERARAVINHLARLSGRSSATSVDETPS